jgi:hypothetical protein
MTRRPTNAIGWIMAAPGLMVPIFSAGGAYATYVMATRGRPVSECPERHHNRDAS